MVKIIPHMAFTKALYYPTIDIQNEAWLKSAALYWDEIRTIVPESIKHPYNNKTAKDMETEGVLIPFSVNPDHRLVRDLSDSVTKYIQSEEAQDFFLIDSHGYRIHMDKLPKIFRMHPEKLPYEIQHLLERNIEDGWLYANNRFGEFYMSLLANKICEDKRFALLANDTLVSNIAEKSKLDSRISMSPYRRDERTAAHLCEGLLTNLIIKGIKINPATKVKDIIKFKNDYSAELGAFRTNITKLVAGVNKEQPLAAITQEISDIYKNEYAPSVVNLEKSLKGANIKSTAETVMKVALITTSATAGLPMLGLSIPQALFVGAAVSITAAKVIYNQDKQQKLRENPYSYVLALNELNKDPFMKNTLI